MAGLAAGYLGEEVIADVDVGVGSGEAVAIVGSNGAGKTTLFRAIAGLLPSMRGRVVLDGKDLTRRPAHRRSRAGIAYVPAERHLFPAMTVKTNLDLGAYPRRPDSSTLELVYGLFPRLQERPRQQAGTLSGGEQQMLAVGRALMARPRVLLLDEPTSGVSSEEKFPLMDRVMAALASEDAAAIFVEHDMDIVTRYSDRVLAFYSGEIIADDPPDQVLSDPMVQRYVTGTAR